MRLPPGQDLLPGSFIDRAIMIADEREAGEGQRGEDARYQALRRLPVGRY